MAAAAEQMGVPVGALTVNDGLVSGPGGKSASYGSLSAAAANPALVAAPASPKPTSQFTLVGTPTNRIDARDIVTGKKRYTLDLTPADLGGITPMPTMVRRPPTINGTVVSVHNTDAVKAMPGVIGVATIPTLVETQPGVFQVGPQASGVAVMAQTFGQALDGVDALDVTWGPGTADTQSNDTIRAALEAAIQPVLDPGLLTSSIDAEFDWAWASHAAMETNCAIADVRPDRATIWSPLQTPIVALQAIAQGLGLPAGSVTAHVIQAGGAFGRKLFYDAAWEAAMVSKALKRPVKLMWHRTDDFRHGRMHPQAHHHIRTTYAGGEVLTWEHRVASVETDFRHGLGEILTAEYDSLPPGLGNQTFSQTVFDMTIVCPYNFGVVSQTLAPEIMPLQFHTGSMRSVYSYNTRGVEEIVVDELAAAMGRDPVAFRLAFLKDPRYQAVLGAVAKAGNWGQRMPAGTAQGVGFHAEFKSCTACLVEIDTNNVDHFGRKIPRVTSATIAVDAGLPINPRGLQANMISGLTDAISYTLLAGVHIINGAPQEGSYAEYHFARQYQSPLAVNVIVMPPTTGDPGGAGELGLAAAVGAIANAYAGDGAPASQLPSVQSLVLLRLRYPAHPAERRSRRSGEQPAGKFLPAALLRRSPRAQPQLHHQRAVGHGRRTRRPPHALGHPGPPRDHRPEVRLRTRCLQSLHQPHQRRRVQPVLGARVRDPAHRRDHDDRRVGRDRRGYRGQWHPPPCPGGLARCRRAPVRVLPARADHGRRRPARQELGRDRCGHRRHPQRLPVRHLHADPRSHQDGSGRDGHRLTLDDHLRFRSL